LVEGADWLGLAHAALQVDCLDRKPVVNGGTTRSTSSLSFFSYS